LKAQNFQIDYSHQTPIKSEAKTKIKIATVNSHQKCVQTGVKFYISRAIWFNTMSGSSNGDTLSIFISWVHCKHY